MNATVTITALTGIPQVQRGDDLAALLLAGLAASGLTLTAGDILAVSSKAVSKAHGLTSASADREATVRAESVTVVAERATPTHVARVVRARAGPVMASAGVDSSNTGAPGIVLVLPRDPDRVCRDLHELLAEATGMRGFGVVLTDTAGRPWRAGQTDFALGAHGIAVLDDLRGRVDTDGRRLDVTARAIADEIAAAADLVKGKVAGRPAALVRGLGAWVTAAPEGVGAGSLVRSGDSDWFALGAQEAVRAALGVPPGSALAESVGIRPAGPGPEPREHRVARAVGVALATGLDADVHLQGNLLEVTGEDSVVVGMVTARLLTALAGEGVAARAQRRGEAVHVILE